MEKRNPKPGTEPSGATTEQAVPAPAGARVATGEIVAAMGEAATR